MKDRSYWCFLSYRHADNKEPGRQWATWLHQKIETYEVPSELVGTKNARGDLIPERIFPVFRDEEELPADADLATPIEGALRNSKFLVVLCSPNAVASPYVAEEILRFKQLGKSDRILAAMIAGEPNASRDASKVGDECFPKPLQHPVDEDGALNAGVLAEPIASDFRLVDGSEGWTTPEAYRQSLQEEGGLGRKEMEELVSNYQKQCDLGYLKIVAGILGLALGTLTERDKAYQLEKARRRNRILVGVAIVMALLAVAAAGAGLMAMRQKKAAVSAQGEAETQRGLADEESLKARRALSRLSYDRGRVLNKGSNPDGALPLLAAALEADGGNRPAAAAFLQNVDSIPRFLPEVLLREEGAPFSLLKVSPSGLLVAAASHEEVAVFALGDEPGLLYAVAVDEMPERLIWSAKGEDLLVLSGSPEVAEGEDPERGASRFAERYGPDGELRFKLERAGGVLDALILESGNQITKQRKGEGMRLECHDPSGKLIWGEDLASNLGMHHRVKDDALLVLLMSRELAELDARTGKIRRSIKMDALAALPKWAFSEEGNHDQKVVFSRDGERMVFAWGRDLGTISDGTSQGVFGALYVFSTREGVLEMEVSPDWPGSEVASTGEALRTIYRGGFLEHDSEDDVQWEGLFCENLEFNELGNELAVALRYGGTFRATFSEDPGCWFFEPPGLESGTTLEVDFDKVGYFPGMERSYAFSPGSRGSGASSPLRPFVQFWEVTEEGCREFALRIQDEDRVVAVSGGGDDSRVVTAHESGAVVLRRLSEPMGVVWSAFPLPQALDEPVAVLPGEGGNVKVIAVESGDTMARLKLPEGREVVAASVARGLVIVGPSGSGPGVYELLTGGRDETHKIEVSAVEQFALSVDGSRLWLVSSGDNGEGVSLHTFAVTDGARVGDEISASGVALLRGTDLAHVQIEKGEGDEFVESNELRNLITGEVRESWEWRDYDEGLRTFCSANVSGYYFEGGYQDEEARIRLVAVDGDEEFGWITPSSRLDAISVEEVLLRVSPDLSRIYLVAAVGKYTQGALAGYDVASGRELFPLREVDFATKMKEYQVMFSPDGRLLWMQLGRDFVDPLTGENCGLPSVPELSGYDETYASLPFALTRRVVFESEPMDPAIASAFSRFAAGVELKEGIPVPLSWPDRMEAGVEFSKLVSRLK